MKAIVVGGGIAGLTAAHTLAQQGAEVRLVEATPHLGGRIHTVAQHAGHVETGMQFYYSSYREAKALLKTLGLADRLRPIPVCGQMYFEGQFTHFDKNKPWLSLLSVLENLKLQWSVARMAVPLLSLDTFDYREDDWLDEIDVADYFRTRGNERILELAARPLVNSYAFREPEGHSLAMLLRIMKLGGLAKTMGLAGGNDLLPRALAKGLPITHARVDHIIIEDGAVRGVHLEGGVDLDADAVVCAVRGRQAASLLPSQPDLAADLAALTYSSVVLANFELDRTLEGPDWVYVFSRRDHQKAAFAIDLLRRCPEMFPGGKSVLQVNFADPVSTEIMKLPDEAIVNAALADLEVYLPNVRAAVRSTSVVRRPEAMPAFLCGMFGAVREIQRKAARVQGLHLAGDYLRAPLCEGAIRSGQDAARAVLERPRLALPGPRHDARAVA